MLKQFRTLRKAVSPVIVYDSKWVEQRVLSSINEEEFEELIDGLEEAETISKKDARAILKQFRTLRKTVSPVIVYDSKWVEQQVLSSINEEEFEVLIDGLEEAETISKKDARAILKQFRTLRKAVSPIIVYDSKWVKQRVLSSINEEEFEELIYGLEEAETISKKDARAMLKQFQTLRKAASPVIVYDSKWVEQRVLSSINEKGFEKLIDGLEAAEKISKKDARAILKQFRTLRKAADDREK